jgi:cullin 3
MINLKQKDSIGRMFRLFTKVPSGLASFRRGLKDSLLRKGQEINDAILNDDGGRDELQVDVKGKGKARANAGNLSADIASKWVIEVLTLKGQFDEIWKDSCESNRDVESTLNEVPKSLLPNDCFAYCIPSGV